jgi:hypothetical protein
VTFKDLQKAIQSLSCPEQSQLLQKLRDKPFWISDPSKHKEKDRSGKGICCFNHIIGLPKKYGVKKPLFDYEVVLYKALSVPGYLNSDPSSNTQGKNPPTAKYNFKVKHLWVKKATGLGVTEFMLRFMAWLCLCNDDCRNSQMVIVTGPNQELAIKLIKRMKELFRFLGINFDSKETVIELNGCSIEAYPSNHIDAFRSLTNPKFILIEEGDFFRKNEQEPFDTCIYKKVFLDYTYGLDKIYSRAEIEKAKASPSFEREYCLKYQGLIGNVFSQSSIELCQKIEYNPYEINPNAKKSIGLDPSFGSSKFGIVATQLVDGKIQVIHAEEYDRPNFTDMINVIWSLKQQYGHVTNIYVGAANPEVWQTLKKEFGEPYNQQYISDQRIECRKYNFHLEDRMIIVPVPFSIEGAHMLQHTKWLLEETEDDGSSLIAIHPTFEKLLTSLRTAVANEYKLDKEQTSYDDILDAFRLSLQFYKRGKI